MAFWESSLVICLLKEVHSEYEARSALSQELLLRLEAVFGAELLLAALDILDGLPSTSTPQPEGPFERTSLICQVQLKDHPDRYVWQVRNTSGLSHVIQPRVHFCSCESWWLHVWHQATHLTCEHWLAVALAQATGRTQERVSEANDWVRLQAHGE